MLLVDHEAQRIDCWAREAGSGWHLRTFAGGEIVLLASLGCQLAVDDVFAAAR